MHAMSVLWLRVATVLYSLGLAHAILLVLRRKSRMFPLALGAFCAGVLLHAVSIVEEAAYLRAVPVNNFQQSASACAFLIAVVFLFIHWRYRFETLSVFLFPLVFVLTLVGALESPVTRWSNMAVRDAWLLVHVMLVLIGYASLLVTAAASVIYLVQERQLKNKRPGSYYAKLPPLGTLDELISKAMSLGFLFITLAVVAGTIWAFIETGTKWIGEPKIGVSLATWGAYLVMVFLRVSAGWRGRKAAFMALAVVGCSALTWAAHVGLRNLFTR